MQCQKNYMEGHLAESQHFSYSTNKRVGNFFRHSNEGMINR